jgi:hypothetical protein
MPYTVTLAMPTRIFETSAVTQTTSSYGIRSHIICVMRCSAVAMRLTSPEYETCAAPMSESGTDDPQRSLSCDC